MTGYQISALIVFVLWGGCVLFFWLKFRTAIFGGRAGRLYRAHRRAHQRKARMLARARQSLDEYAEPYGDASTYMIGERNG